MFVACNKVRISMPPRQGLLKLLVLFDGLHTTNAEQTDAAV